jgi:hypothetical protein
VAFTISIAHVYTRGERDLGEFARSRRDAERNGTIAYGFVPLVRLNHGVADYEDCEAEFARVGEFLRADARLRRESTSVPRHSAGGPFCKHRSSIACYANAI